MNNSQFVIEHHLLQNESVDLIPQWRARESTIARILKAIRYLQKTEEWRTLKTEVFDNLTVSLKNRLTNEAKKESPDTLKLNRISGELKWAERYSNLDSWESELLEELKVLKLKLNGKTEETS